MSVHQQNEVAAIESDVISVNTEPLLDQQRNLNSKQADG